MAALLSLMALTGALDPATSRGDSRAVADVAARYLPITAGAAGWFGNILETLGPRTAEAMPDPESALADILHGDYQLTVPELSRLVYVIGALCHTPTFASMVPLRETPLAQALALAGPFYHDRERATIYCSFSMPNSTAPKTGISSSARPLLCNCSRPTWLPYRAACPRRSKSTGTTAW
jgi:hypothetical protein